MEDGRVSEDVEVEELLQSVLRGLDSIYGCLLMIREKAMGLVYDV